VHQWTYSAAEETFTHPEARDLRLSQVKGAPPRWEERPFAIRITQRRTTLHPNDQYHMTNASHALLTCPFLTLTQLLPQLLNRSS